MKIATYATLMVLSALAWSVTGAYAQAVGGGSAAGQNATIASEPIATPPWASFVQSAPWSGHDLTFEQALTKETNDLWRLPDPPRIVLEGWDQDMAIINYIRPLEHYSMTPEVLGIVGINPKMREFSIDTQNKTYGAILDEICTKGLDQIWHYDPGQKIVSFGQKDLLRDPRWRLNERLGPAANQRLTFEQAFELFVDSYGWMAGATNHPMCRDLEEYEKIKDLVVWEPTSDPALTARDLLFAMIRVAEANRLPPSDTRRMTPYYYYVHITPEVDSRAGYAGFASRKRLHWMVNINYVFEDMASIQKWADMRMQEKIKERALYGSLVDQPVKMGDPGDE